MLNSITEYTLNNRREFLKQMFTAGALVGLAHSPILSYARKNLLHLTILHTNDTHSRIEPFPANDSKNPGVGGFARRAAIIKKIRNEEPHVLLFDSGDIFQGTPYFNKYDGELEFKLMSQMRYNASTIGNHEFDNGLEKLAEVMKNAEFPFISSNYDFSNTPLKDKTIPYKIFEIENLKIGVMGLGVELKGLVSPALYGNTIYKDPAETAAALAYKLKKELNCDLIICLSHLGLKYENDQISDMKLAKQSKYIDVILGGHSHTLIEKPYRLRNSDDKEIIICQEGANGVRLGKLDFYFERKTKLKFAAYYTTKKINNQV